MSSTFINDNDYSNFSLREMMEKAKQRRKDLAGGQLRSDVDKSKKELEDTKSELQKTKEEVEKLKSDTIKVAEQQTPNLPTTKSKLPLIIGGALVFVIATFVLIKKLKK